MLLWHTFGHPLVSDIAVFVLKRDVKLQLTLATHCRFRIVCFLVKLRLFCSYVICFWCVGFSFFSTMPRDGLGRTSPKWTIFRSSPTIDLVDRNWGVSVCPYFHPCIQKRFSDFDLIWCVGRPPPHMCTSVTLTRYKVKVKVTDLPKLLKLHFSRSISFAVLA